MAMCTFEGARFVGKQVDSILRQTHPVAEIVVADDGSTDSTLQIIQDVIAKSEIPASSKPIVRILSSQGRLGVAANFERALLACSHEFIALSDQDDIWLDDRIERQVGMLLANSRLTLVHGDANLIGEADELLGMTLFESLRVRPREVSAIAQGDSFGVFIRRNLATGATVMVRRSQVLDSTPFPTGWLHDEWLAILASATGRVGVLQEPLISYRQHTSNQVGASDPGLKNRLRRLTEPRGGRLLVLRDRSRALSHRLGASAEFSDAHRRRADGKAKFETDRALMPAARLARVPTVLRLLASGAYASYASQGCLDAVRDLIQPS